MLYVIDNEREYELRKLWLIETDVQPARVRELLNTLGPYSGAKEDLAPHIVLITDVMEWCEPWRRGALFDSYLWYLHDEFAGGPEDKYADESDQQRHKLMKTALREESVHVLTLFAKQPMRAADIPTRDWQYDDSIPRIARTELKRRGVVLK